MSIGLNNNGDVNNNRTPEPQMIYGILRPNQAQKPSNVVPGQAQMVYGIQQPAQDMFVPSPAPEMYAVYGIQTAPQDSDTFVRTNRPDVGKVYGIQMPDGQQ